MMNCLGTNFPRPVLGNSYVMKVVLVIRELTVTGGETQAAQTMPMCSDMYHCRHMPGAAGKRSSSVSLLGDEKTATHEGLQEKVAFSQRLASCLLNICSLPY